MLAAWDVHVQLYLPCMLGMGWFKVHICELQCHMTTD